LKEPLDPIARWFFRADVRCYCGHLPTEHGLVNLGCGVGMCECITYRPDQEAARKG